MQLAINGYGRIGRSFLRAFYEANQEKTTDIDIVAINELGNIETMAHLTKYDSTHGVFHQGVNYQGQHLIINNDKIAVLNQQSISQCPWDELAIDCVLECTGTFSTKDQAQEHLKSGAKRVLFSEPADASVDATIVMGVNENDLKSEHKIISSASCTTNCIVPIIDVLDRQLGIEHGVITTIHSAMNDQPVIDAYHNTDLRKTRSAMQSIIPVDTGLAKGIERILPHLMGRFQAQAMRVPTVNVSAIDISVVIDKPISVALVNELMREAAENLTQIIGYTEAPLASCDFNHDTRSVIVDASQTRVAGDHLLKLLVWFDNEWGFANRMLDLVGELKKFNGY